MRKKMFLLLSAITICLPAWCQVFGDVDGDGKVDVSDVNAAINIILELKAPSDYLGNADIAGNDNKVDVADVNAIINIILNGEPSESGITTYTVNGVSFNMVAVEGGTFTMGATDELYNNDWRNGKPVHEVTLSSYSIGETEVTRALWLAVMGTTPARVTEGGYDGDLTLPATWLTWSECDVFARKLSKLTGETFRMPTEAEWEFAARGGNKSKGYRYAGSNNIDDVAWYNNNSGNGFHPVATKVPNELGLYDMSGSVVEWCRDWFGTYSSEPQTDPTGASNDNGTLRNCVHRGGWRRSDANDCRVYTRNSYDKYGDATFAGLCFRLAK